MKYQNFWKRLGFLFGDRGTVQNLVPSILYGQNEEGVVEYINTAAVIKAQPFLDILQMRKCISEEKGYTPELKADFAGAYEKAKQLFLVSPKGISEIGTQEQLQIVRALGLHEVYHFYNDEYFEDEDDGILNLENLFEWATEKERNSLVYGLMLYFAQEGKEVYWTPEREEMFVTMTKVVVNEIFMYENKNPELLRFLIDSWGIQISFDQGNDEKFVSVLDFASEKNISLFFEKLDTAILNRNRLAFIERIMHAKDKETLFAMIKVLGCHNSYVEGYLLHIRRLPSEGIAKSFCHPENFETLVASAGIKNVVSLFPQNWQKTMPNLWKWVSNYNNPELEIKREECSDNEWKYLLANEHLCNRFIAQKGCFLTWQDVDYLTSIGRYEFIAKQRGK